MILLEAEYDSNVWEMAMRRAMDVDASDEYTLRPDYPVPSRWEFAGTRKIVEVRQDSDGVGLANGDELTFNTLYLDEEAIDTFISGEECDAIIGNEAEEILSGIRLSVSEVGRRREALGRRENPEK